MMSLEDAVDLVVYAFPHGVAGGHFVQKAPAATIGTLAEAVRSLFRAEGPVQGHRHAARREALRDADDPRGNGARDDLGGYYPRSGRQPGAELRRILLRGQSRLAEIQDYHSHNVRRLDVAEMTELLRKLPTSRRSWPAGPATGPGGRKRRPHARTPRRSRSREGPTIDGDSSVKTILITGAGVHRPESRGPPETARRRRPVDCDSTIPRRPARATPWSAEVVVHLAGVNRPRDIRRVRVGQRRAHGGPLH